MADTISEYSINTRKGLILYICICAIMFMILLFGSVGISTLIINLNKYKTYVIFMFICFWTGTFFVQLLMNISIGKKQKSCSSDNSYSGNNALLITLMPWIFILGIFMILLYFTPGLLRIFSNTIGMAIVYDTFRKDIDTYVNDQSQSSKVQENENMKNIYIKLSNEPQLIINEIEYSSDDGFNEIYKKYCRSFPFIFTEDEKFKRKIRQLIISKNLMGYAIWIALVGTIASLVSTNAMINVECG
jgi:hypothetical protein